VGGVRGVGGGGRVRGDLEGGEQGEWDENGDGGGGGGGGSGDEGEEDFMFAEMKENMDKDTQDEYLKTLTGILTNLHARFYAQDSTHRDVRVLLARRQAEILEGVKVVFSGFSKHPTQPASRRQQDKRNRDEEKLAVSLGATSCEEVADCTHLLAIVRKHDRYTEKLLDALAPPPAGKAPVEIVRPDWLSASKWAWKRMNEEDFRLPGVDVCIHVCVFFGLLLV
jgi:hypothetical protein